MFPEFASQFFDAACAGGVDVVPQVVSDFQCNALKPIYRSAALHISSYAVDYSLLPHNGISPTVHLLEASLAALVLATLLSAIVARAISRRLRR